jgi:hypothetical protein
MEVSTTAMIIITAWFRRSQFQSCPLMFPTLCRAPIVCHSNNNDETWFGSHRVTPTAPNTVTKQCPYRLAHSPDLRNRTNERTKKRRRRCSPPPIRVTRHCGITRHRPRRIASITTPINYPTTRTTTMHRAPPPFPRVRNGRTGRPTVAWRHAYPPRVMPCGLDRA